MNKLKAAATEIMTIFEIDGDEVIGPYSVAIDIFRTKLNNSFDMTVIGVGDFGELTSDHNGTGILGSLIRNETQFGIIPLTPSAKVVDCFDYSTTTNVFPWHFVSGLPKIFHKDLFESLECFQKTLWISTILAFLAFSCIWTAMRVFRGKPHQSHLKTFEDSILHVFAVFMRQDSIPVKSLYGRLLWISWDIASFYLTMSFNCLLLSKLAKKDDPFRYEQLEDFVTHPIKLYVLQDTPPYDKLKYSEDSLRKTVWDKVVADETAVPLGDINFLKFFEEVDKGESSILAIPSFVLQVIRMYCGSLDVYISERSFTQTMKVFLMRRDLDEDTKIQIKSIALRTFEGHILEEYMERESRFGEHCLGLTEIEHYTQIPLNKLYFIIIFHWISLAFALLYSLFERIFFTV